jgi:quercetin dioxygenase-like cupin family protein
MQRTLVRHARDDAFTPGQLPGFTYRDLGIADVTGGKFVARVIRAVPDAPAQDDWHRHDQAFSITYVLKGWLEVEFEDIGLQRVEPGSVIYSWNGPRHRELRCGGDLEILSVTSSVPMGDTTERRAVVQHARDAEFEAGLRDYFVYRDFGVNGATKGAIGAHMVKVVPGTHPHGHWHTHDLGFQFVYVLDGWVEFEYEDIGRVRLERGSMVYQPPLIRHAEVAHSDDVVILEIVAPGDFATREVAAPAGVPQAAE